MCDINDKSYTNIKSKEYYMLLLNSGMFWEIYPELTGNWDVDKLVIESSISNV